VPFSDDFPTGVKVTYRTYAQDDAVEILAGPMESFPCGLFARSCKSTNQPAATSTSPEGMYLLRSLPTKPIKPKGFIPGDNFLIIALNILTVF
jgi:hypothetical protein